MLKSLTRKEELFEPKLSDLSKVILLFKKKESMVEIHQFNEIRNMLKYYFNMKKDTLTCQVRYLDSVSLNPTGPFTFKKDKWITLEFENNYNGFTLNTGRTKNIKFKRIKN